MKPHQRPVPPDGLTSLATTLRAAASAVAEVLDDPLLARLLRVFADMPEGDRETIVGVLEHEVRSRRLHLGTRNLTGWETRANPRARLYVRTIGPAEELEVTDHGEILLGTLRLTRVMPVLLDPALHDVWRDATREALELTETDERAAFRAVCSEAVDILGDVERAEANGEPIVLK